MSIYSEEIEKYCEVNSTSESEVKKMLSRETKAKILGPRMLSGHLQGNLLEMISCMIKPNYVLEIGTYTGYSAICLSKGLQINGKLITIDINEELEDFTRPYFEKANIEDQIEYRIGNALDIIPTLDCLFDLVFLDADKENYWNYFELVIDKMPKGGFIIADNVLWSGKVIQEVHPNDKDTKALIKFNKKIAEDSRVEVVILPFRDGLSFIRKL
ncbi:MAG: class I SAM-dependent methyltransferase [Bacteroidota bacterium]